MNNVNKIWKIGKQHAELTAAYAALEKIASFGLDGVLTSDELNSLSNAREIIERGINRLADRIERISEQQAQ